MGEEYVKITFSTNEKEAWHFEISSHPLENKNISRFPLTAISQER